MSYEATQRAITAERKRRERARPVTRAEQHRAQKLLDAKIAADRRRHEAEERDAARRFRENIHENLNRYIHERSK